MRMKGELLNKVLVAIIILLVVVIASGTIAAKIQQRNRQSPQNHRALIATGKAVNLAEPASTTETSYFALGTLRITTLNDDEDNMLGIGLVLSPWLAYPAGDTIFYEELDRKKNVLKAVFQHYFSERTKEQILSATEEKIITDLTAEVNQRLSLGRVSDVYFTDYLFLE